MDLILAEKAILLPWKRSPHPAHSRQSRLMQPHSIALVLWPQSRHTLLFSLRRGGILASTGVWDVICCLFSRSKGAVGEAGGEPCAARKRHLRGWKHSR